MILTKKKVFNKKEKVEDKNGKRINDEIVANEVMVVGEGIETKKCSLKEALKIAEEMGLDLVEVSKDNNPPVCKLMNYEKFLYKTEKDKGKALANMRKNKMAEIQLGPNIDENDKNLKLRHAIEFLENKRPLRVRMMFKGRRMMALKEKGKEIFDSFIKDLENVGVKVGESIYEEKVFYATLNPKKNTK